MYRRLTLALCLAAAQAALAQSVLAQPPLAQAALAPEKAMVAEGVAQVALLGGWRQADGTRMAAVEIALAPGWHTYWRAPGDSGVPPSFDWSGSANLEGAAIEWPRPELFQNRGGQSIGYSGKLVLPILLTPSQPDQPIELSLNLFFGVCDAICLPAQARLTAVLGPDAGTRDPAIVAALADRPRGARAAGVTRVTCALVPGPDGLELATEVSFAADPGADQFAVIEAGDPGVWIGLPRSETDGRKVTSRAALEPSQGGPGAVLDRAGLRITLLDPTRAVDIRGCDAPG